MQQSKPNYNFSSQQPKGIAAKPMAPPQTPMPPLLMAPPAPVQVQNRGQLLDLHAQNVNKALQEGVLSHKMNEHSFFSPDALRPECTVPMCDPWIHRNMLNIIDSMAEKYPGCGARQLMGGLEMAFKAGMQCGANYMQLKQELYNRPDLSMVQMINAGYPLPAPASNTKEETDKMMQEFLVLDSDDSQ